MIFRGISQNKSLVSLDVSNNGLTNLSVKYMKKYLINSNLIELNLEENRINEDGIKDLSQLVY